MYTRKKFLRLTGIALAAVFILSACNTAATVAPAPTWTAMPPTEVPSATETPMPTVTSTLVATATAIPTATVPPVAQVVPSVNAYCRSGPGSNYNQVTILTSGTAYDVVGRNSSNTWWLVQLYGGAVTCWTGAPGTKQLGAVEQAPIALAQPVLPSPAMFMYSYSCNPGSSNNTFNVTLSWDGVAGATGYHLSRNGVSLASVGESVGSYTDFNAPMNVNLMYELEALNAVGSTAPVYVMVPACH
jgi:hypothetical protein